MKRHTRNSEVPLHKKIAVVSQDEHAFGQKTPTDDRVAAWPNFFCVGTETIANKYYKILIYI